MPSGKKTRIDDPEQWLQRARQMIRAVHGPVADQDIMMRDFDPLMTLAVAATDPNVPLQSRGKMSRELAEFLYAKKKAVEVDGDFASDPTIEIVVWGGDGQTRRVSKAQEMRTIKGGDDAGEVIPLIEAQEVPARDDDV